MGPGGDVLGGAEAPLLVLLDDLHWVDASG
jgi:predicted ATPase